MIQQERRSAQRSLPKLSPFQANVVFIVGILLLLSDVGLLIYERAFMGEVLGKGELITHGVWGAVGLALAVPRRTLAIAEWIVAKLPLLKKG